MSATLEPTAGDVPDDTDPTPAGPDVDPEALIDAVDQAQAALDTAAAAPVDTTLSAVPAINLDDDSGVVVLQVGERMISLPPPVALTYAMQLASAAAAAQSQAALVAWHRRNAGLTDAQLRPLIAAMHAATQT